MVKRSVDEITRSLFLLKLSMIIILKFAECQLLILGDPCVRSANYDGTDIARPYMVDNSTGTPVYAHVEIEDYHPPSLSKRAATRRRNSLWPLGIVPYSLDSRFPAAEREKILDAMRHWEENTCIRFHPVPTRSMSYGGVYFIRGIGCCTYVGRLHGIIQSVSIASFCSYASVIHEIGHVLGFWHEQSRPDRDEYITIHEENIRTGYKSDFNKINDIDSLGLPYDFNSIMHYSQYAFAKPGTITMSTKEDGIPFGKALELSRLDIIQTELLYKNQCRQRSSSVSRLPKKVTTPTTPSPVILPDGECNRHFLGKTGQIYAPDTPYKPNTTCIWIIEVPKGYKIQLELYDIKLDSPCLDDVGNYISVYPGYNENGRLLRKLCGSKSYEKLSISGLYAYIKFHTNSEVNSKKLKGFSNLNFTALDINECNFVNCDHSCENLPGSYKCSCREGYYLTGAHRCFDINECGYDNGKCSHKCVNMGGTYRCECPSRYTLLSNKRDCYKGQLPCRRNNGGCEQICTNTLDGPLCSCRKGYFLFFAGFCVDINECSLNKGICGDNVCFNTRGDYLCLCLPGYQQTANKTCKDINECSNGSPCGDNKRCINTPGSYYCECDLGYANTSEGCVDINECLNDNGGCNHNCVNTQGSFQCLCNASYVLAADNKTCISGCDSYTIVHESSGNISTIGYPTLLYASDSNCTWVIDLPVTYKSIELKFDKMSIEESSNCNKDKLTIFNGKDKHSVPMAKYCGSRSPFTILSSTETVTINFQSDGVVNKNGFSLQYRGLTERPQGVYDCDIQLKETTTFALATFPSKYTNPMNCSFTLTAPSRYGVKLNFLYLDIQDADCSKDRIEVYRGKSLTPNKKFADICNGTYTTELISKRRHMIVRFIGNTLHKYRGFHASLMFITAV